MSEQTEGPAENLEIDPKKMIERTQAGDWRSDLIYMVAYQACVLRPQKEDFRWAYNIKRIQKSSSPFDKRRGRKELLKMLEKAITDNAIAALSATLERTDKRLKEDRIEWRITLEGLIVLAAQELRVTNRWSRLNSVDPHADLRKVLQAWERKNGRIVTASDDGNWSSALTRPEIAALLTACKKPGLQ